jgi:hypothetical protein
MHAEETLLRGQAQAATRLLSSELRCALLLWAVRYPCGTTSDGEMVDGVWIDPEEETWVK